MAVNLTNPDEPDSTNSEYLPETKRIKIATKQQKYLNLAVVGCSHGEMDKIYDTLQQLEQKRNTRFDLLIFFIGGNHESSGYMLELPNGGWVAPNIYYMGYASVVRFGDLRIAGLSGIFKAYDYNRGFLCFFTNCFFVGHFEKPPLSNNEMVSAYHVRSVDLFRLKQLKARDDELNDSRLDAVVSHDWPCGITDFGNKDLLFRFKPFLRNDIEQGKLGNPATMDLLRTLQPKRWFSAHMHVKFEAEIFHEEEKTTTKFLALDKPLPKRKFLESFQIPFEMEEDNEEPLRLSYDLTWLAILKNTDFLTEVTSKNTYMPGKNGLGNRYDFRPTEAELEEVKKLFGNDLNIPYNFRQTAPPETSPYQKPRNIISTPYYRNPQTKEFCEKLGIKDLNLLLCESEQNIHNIGTPYYLMQSTSLNNFKDQPTTSISIEDSNFVKNNEEIDINDIGEDDEESNNDAFGDNMFIIDAVGTKET